MKAVAIQTENGSRIIINPAQVRTIQALKEPDHCALDMGGKPIRVRMSPQDMAALLGWEVPAAEPATPAATKGSSGPAAKTVKAGVKKGKIKAAKATIAGKSGMAI